MATRTITETDCDACETRNVPVQSFHVAVGRDPDPAGGPSEIRHKCFDLCVKCMSRVIYTFVITQMSHAEGDRFVADTVGERYR
jgi:hypothetical protein